MKEQPSSPPPSMKGVENHILIAVPVGQVVVKSERRPMNEANVAELMDSIQSVGILNPIVVERKVEDGAMSVRLVAGLHRLEAAKRLGLETIQRTVLDQVEALRVELAEIDENFIRNDPSAAGHALLTGRRAEIIKALNAQDGTLSQNATPSRQAQRRAGKKPGPDIGSVRDQANKTGETKDRIQRSKKRYDTLGSDILKNIEGTSLDTGVELDALTNLPDEVRDNLINRAAGGEAVSAKRVLREAKRGAVKEPQHKSLEHAFDEFWTWTARYGELLRPTGLFEQFERLLRALSDAIGPPEETELPEQTSERPKKRKFLGLLKDRKGD